MNPGEVAAQIATEGCYDLARSLNVVVPAAAFADMPAYHSHNEVAAKKRGLPLLKPSEFDPTQHYTAYRLRDYIAIPEVRELIFKPEIYQIAQAYLGECHFDSITIWKTLANERPSLTAQRLHRDTFRGRSISLFFLITDVGEPNGPHNFVRYSHHIPSFAAALLKTKDGSLDDLRLAEIIYYSYALEDGNWYRLDDMVQRYAPDLLFRHLGPAGTALLTDPRGIHRGDPVMLDHRIMVSIRWHPGKAAPYQPGHLKAELAPMIRDEASEVIAAGVERFYTEIYAN